MSVFRLRKETKSYAAPYQMFFFSLPAGTRQLLLATACSPLPSPSLPPFLPPARVVSVACASPVCDNSGSPPFTPSPSHPTNLLSGFSLRGGSQTLYKSSGLKEPR
ncbi:hypothetical protein PoB_002045000 [Plakobranchus ocellatus]|uniref:Uncharacterized protein n=1 Tax=Plakobranchus ocellatus TaxID=259542 RepID=A0AAV3ZFM1_9GAST|nr:hypothetical protein PoB_002045000 [Plakobranchus ocellatus]